MDYNADQSNEIIPARHQARFSGSLITNRIGKKENVLTKNSKQRKSDTFKEMGFIRILNLRIAKERTREGRPHSIKQVPELRAGRMKSTNLRVRALCFYF